MHCLATAAHGSLATPAVTNPAAPADVSPKTLTYVSPATAVDVSPKTVTIQSHVSRCQELFLWQAQGLASDIVDHRVHMVISVTTHHCYHEPFPGDAVSKYHILIMSPAVALVGQWVPAFS